MDLLKGKNIIITGGSSGLGRACAIKCTEAGANVHLLGRNIDALSELCMSMQGHNTYHKADMRNPDDFAAIISNIVTECGTIDGLVYSAGYQKTSSLSATNTSDYLGMYMVNTVSAFELCRIISKRQFHSGSGASLVLISSVMSVVASAGLTAYCASKAAMVSGARAMALELAKKGIRVNCISPGHIQDTPMMDELFCDLSETEREGIIKEYPMGLGKSHDVAAMCLHLLSADSKWVNGQNFVLDGGYSIR